MNLGSTPQVGNVQGPQNDLSLFLRANQRVNAEVVAVNGDRVVLSIQGVQIVARLSSAAAAAELLERRTAQFVVKSVTPNAVNLQLAQTSGSGNASPTLSFVTQDLAPQLLSQLGVDNTGPNQTIIRAMFTRGLAINMQSFAEIKAALSEFPTWGDREAQMAATLKSVGMPVTSGALRLSLRALNFNMSESMANLSAQLTALAANNPALQETLKDGLSFLNQLAVHWGGSPEGMASDIQAALKALGTPIEKQLAAAAPDLSEGMAQLTRMRNALAQNGQESLASQIDRLMDGMRMTQWLNSGRHSDPFAMPFAQFDLPLKSNENGQQGEFHPAKVRVSVQNGGNKYRGGYTHLAVQVDIDDADSVAVNLDLAANAAIALISTSSQPLSEIALEELPAFSEGLSRSGLTLKSSKVQVTEKPELPRIDTPEWDPALFHSVDMEL